MRKKYKEKLDAKAKVRDIKFRADTNQTLNQEELSELKEIRKREIHPRANDQKIIGLTRNRSVHINGYELHPGESVRVYSHSPDGFNWGYPGSGPAQLALAIMLKFAISKNEAVELYQDFKSSIISQLPGERDFCIDIRQIKEWLAGRRSLRNEREERMVGQDTHGQREKKLVAA